jgi:hypothetical protein
MRSDLDDRRPGRHVKSPAEYMMPRDLMTECERRTLYKINGERQWRWKAVAVADIVDVVPPVELRCANCSGAVRLYQKKAATGPQSYAEHRVKQDSEGCRAGHYFQGTHRMSSVPVI